MAMIPAARRVVISPLAIVVARGDTSGSFAIVAIVARAPLLASRRHSRTAFDKGPRLASRAGGYSRTNINDRVHQQLVDTIMVSTSNATDYPGTTTIMSRWPSPAGYLRPRLAGTHCLAGPRPQGKCVPDPNRDKLSRPEMRYSFGQDHHRR